MAPMYSLSSTMYRYTKHACLLPGRASLVRGRDVRRLSDYNNEPVRLWRRQRQEMEQRHQPHLVSRAFRPDKEAQVARSFSSDTTDQPNVSMEDVQALIEGGQLVEAQRILHSSADPKTQLQALETFRDYQTSKLTEFDSTKDQTLLQTAGKMAEIAHNLLETCDPTLRTINLWNNHQQPHGPEIIRGCAIVLELYARAVRAGYVHPGLPQRAQFLLGHLEAPDTESYNHVLECWKFSREHQRGTAADALFSEIPNPDATSYRIITHCWSLSREPRSAFKATGYMMRVLFMLKEGELSFEMAEPTLEDYHLVFRAWRVSREKTSPYKAHTLLKLIEKRVREGVIFTGADEKCYRYVLQTAANRPWMSDLGVISDEVLLEMKSKFMVPDSDSYTACIQIWKNAALLAHEEVAQEARETSVQKCLRLLSEMSIAHNQTAHTSVVIKTKNVNDVLEALSVSNDPERFDFAEKLFRNLETNLENNAGAVPDGYSYVWMLKVVGSMEHADKGAKAKLLMQKVSDNASRLSHQNAILIEFFNSFVSLCGAENNQEPVSEAAGMRAIQEALGAIEVMRSIEGVSPNSATYAAVLRACANQVEMGPLRDSTIGKVFELCCSDGMVNGNVLKALEDVATTELYSHLVVARSSQVEGEQVVPESWTRRVLAPAPTGRSRTKPLTIQGTFTKTRRMLEYQMRRLRDGRNRNLLRGGRLPAPVEEKRPRFRLKVKKKRQPPQ